MKSFFLAVNECVRWVVGVYPLTTLKKCLLLGMGWLKNYIERVQERRAFNKLLNERLRKTYRYINDIQRSRKILESQSGSISPLSDPQLQELPLTTIFGTLYFSAPKAEPTIGRDSSLFRDSHLFD